MVIQVLLNALKVVRRVNIELGVQELNIVAGDCPERAL